MYLKESRTFSNLDMPKTPQAVLLVSLMSVGLSVLLGSAPGGAIPVEQVPNPHALNNQIWVSDPADQLSASAENAINAKLTQLQKESGVEVAVVIVRDIAPESNIESYANKLFNQWKIGQAGTNNGVLILWAPGNRKMRIETGAGAKAMLSDVSAQAIVNTQALPEFRQETPEGNDRGVGNSVDGVIEAVHGADQVRQILFWLPIGAAGSLLVSMVALSRRFDRRRWLPRTEEPKESEGESPRPLKSATVRLARALLRNSGRLESRVPRSEGDSSDLTDYQSHGSSDDSSGGFGGGSSDGGGASGDY